MKFIALLLTSFILTSCSLGTRFTYSYELQEPLQSKENKYTDENIDVHFTIDDKGFNFKLYNLTSERISILWNESSIVIFDEANALMHSGTKYTDAGKDQIPSTVPPKAFIDDRVILINNVTFRSGDKYTQSGWVIKEMLRIYDLNNKKVRQKIFDNKGKQIGLFLPIESKDGIREYYFKFKITDIQKYKPKPPTWTSIYD